MDANEERIAALEKDVADLILHDNATQQNFAALNRAFHTDLPAAFKGQDDVATQF